MAVGKESWPEIFPVAGVSLGVAAAGIKYPNRHDIVVIDICDGATVAGVFTQNAFCAEPVKVARAHLKQSGTRLLVINSGNANACTGAAGYEAAIKTCQAAADLKQVAPESVLPFSTGVIGELLPADKLINALPAALGACREENWLTAAKAIMTTDTRPKGASKQVEVGGDIISITGIAKGAGMINPNMGTMLGYVATDAAIAQNILEKISLECAQKSFNRITIDGDTSTNDSCILIATGAKASNQITDSHSEEYLTIKEAILEVYQSLALQIVEDGEGATKCVEVYVRGGASAQESLDVAYAIAHSPLVKTAMFASDPNWGRIVAAIGYAGIQDLNVESVRVWLDDVLLVEKGGRASSYTEEAGQTVVSKERYQIQVDLARGDFDEVIWTTDLSHEYIRINAEYRS